MGDARRKGTRQRKRTGQHALHQADRIAAVTDTIRALLHATGAVTEQSAQVVGQHFGGNVNDTVLLAQAADAFDFQAVLRRLKASSNASVGGTAAQTPPQETPVHPSWRASIVARGLNES